jgi:AcrR family transcriptional regulator
MKRYNKDTEDKILLVAQRIFREKGYNGTKTQEIADEAGINKALLHYYFTSKAILFEKVFLLSLEEVFSVLGGYLNNDQPLKSKLPFLITSYLKYISKNVNLFVFVISEISQNQNFTEKFVKIALHKINFEQFITSFKREVAEGTIKDIDPIQFLINLVSLCVFPFLASPLITSIFATIDFDSDSFFLQRREVIISTLLAMVEK